VGDGTRLALHRAGLDEHLDDALLGGEHGLACELSVGCECGLRLDALRGLGE